MWPHFAEDEIQAVTNVLRSGKVNYWTGDECRKFEKEFAAYIGTDYAVALTNGTVAIELALYALGVGAGDEVILTPRTFVATASAIVMRGATPIFADVDLDSGNITAETIAKVITKKTKAIICVHLAGWPCEMDKIMELAEKHNLFVIEDCAQAHGASYKGKKVGSWGHINAFSFCQDKIMTTGGEGGMVLTNNKQLWGKMWAFKDHGKSYDAVYNTQHPEGFRWLHESFGTNWRMFEIQGALGRIQLRKLPLWLQLREHNALMYMNVLSQYPCIRMPIPSKEIVHAYYKLHFFIDLNKLALNWDRDRIMNNLTEKGLPCFSGSCSEIYLEKCFDNNSGKPLKRLPNAKVLGETSLVLLVHPTLSEKEIIRSIQILEEVLSSACKMPCSKKNAEVNKS